MVGGTFAANGREYEPRGVSLDREGLELNIVFHDDFQRGAYATISLSSSPRLSTSGFTLFAGESPVLCRAPKFHPSWIRDVSIPTCLTSCSKARGIVGRVDKRISW